ncbi:MAG: MBL fold metallo-hydrolase [Hyphomonas oceanitis]|uniref:MBL fold metallo-hydrolase n=1 Tax=Hyphomonas oceanitis TaxID=81033 RepID=UPI003001FD6A
MLKWILGIAGALIVVAAAAGWWLFAGFSHAPKAAAGLMDIAQWRSMVREGGGTLPTQVRVLEVGRDSAPMVAARAGAFGGKWQTSYNSVQLVYPDKTIIIGGALDRQTSEGMVAAPKDWSFDDAAYEQLIAAMLRADRVLITHEHLDHVMAIARAPQPDALAPRLVLNALQIAAMPQFAIGELAPAVRDVAPRLDGSVQLVAPGVVAIPVPGHTAGSQMVFITLENGHEYLMIGDIVWTMTSLDELVMRPVFTQYAVIDPNEDRTAVKDQIRALHDLWEANPELTVFPSHDRTWLEMLEQQGLISWGFQD